MQNSTRQIAFAGVAAVGLITGLETVAHAASFGPASWSDGDDTARYRREPGEHNLAITDCGSASTYKKMEFRVDKVGETDIGYGNKSYSCDGTTRVQNSGYDTRLSDFRGHFMQARDNFYGTMHDK